MNRANSRKSKRLTRKPPPALDCARLLHYAVVDKSVGYSGRTLFVDGKELGRVPHLAICVRDGSGEVLLFHCARNWRVLGCSAHESVVAAKHRAEKVYSGLSSRWIESGVTRAEADRFLEKLFGNQHCDGCGRRPDQVEQLFTKGRLRICDECLREIWQMAEAETRR